MSEGSEGRGGGEGGEQWRACAFVPAYLQACATDVPASPPERPALAQLDSELARVVTLPTALAAARQAKTRQRLNAAKAAARARAV